LTAVDITLHTSSEVHSIRGSVSKGDTGISDLASITVMLLSQNGVVLQSTTTESDGSYSFAKSVPAGSYTAKVAAIEGVCVESTSGLITVGEQDISDANITLAKEAATTFTVSGKVTAGEGVDGSNLTADLIVTLYKKNTEQGFDATQLTATTTKNDETNDIEFSIANVPAGTYKAVIAADSGKYAESASAEFTVNDANVTSANIPLLPEGQGGSIEW